MKEYRYKDFGGLIKWPQCVITGKKISIDQAREVLAKTDSMFVDGYDGNHLDYNKKIYEIIGRPQMYYENKPKDIMGLYHDIESFKEKRGMLHLEYLYNAQISSCYIYGTYGWCHPNGVIFYNKNIGKWPSWEEIHNECRMLAHSFPFLDMKVYLFNQEWSTDRDKGEYYDYPRECMGGFSIKNGRCRLLKKSEFLSPNDDLVISHPFNRTEEKIAEKREIFGDKADIDILKKTNELFFNIDEFKEYFKGFLV